MSKRDPADCHVCGRHAIGIGFSQRGGDNRYLCAECVTILEHIHSARRFDAYELKAREGGMDAGAEFVEKHGTDLAEWPEAVVLDFVGAVWRGCADRIRHLIRDDSAPF